MFGYRLIRERDYDRLLETIDADKGEIRQLHKAVADTLRECAQLSATAAGKTATAAHLEVMHNAASMERANLLNKITGVPAVAPQLGHGNPLMSDGVNMFEDVGDARAREMEAAGQLTPAPFAFPSAADLTAAAAGTE